MRIALDARAYFQRTGIARYTRAFVHALATATTGQHELLVLISNHHAPSEITLPPHVTIQVSQAEWLGGASELSRLDAEVAAWRADVFHGLFPPHVLDRTPSIVTLFDVTPLSHPRLHREDVREAFTSAWTRLQAAPARTAVPVSRATCLAAARFGVTAGESIGIGMSPELLGGRKTVPRPGARDGVLFVGTLEPRKNLPLLLEAAEVLAARGTRVPVTVVGKVGWGDVPETVVARAGLADFRGFVNDDTLGGCYASHAILACPSAEEGFGLPVLEAITHGVLPLVSPAPALTELVEDQRLVVPLDAHAWADAIAWWLAHAAAREEATVFLARRARERFAWEAIASAWLVRYARVAAREAS